jgi:hypothetical protein
LKQNIHQGILEGFSDGKDYLAGIMVFYIEPVVNQAYTSASTSSDKYVRTHNLEKSIKAEVIGNAIYVYSDSSIAPYNERVVEGLPYDYPWIPKGSTGDFRVARDFVEATRKEFIDHMNQSQVFMDIVVAAIKKRIG